MRRLLVCLLAGILLAGPLAAQDYPAHPLRVIAPFAPGAATDTTIRAVASELSRLSGQTVSVVNIPGEDGQTGAAAAAAAKPDGYTILITTQTTQSINPYIYRNLPYDPVKSFAPVTALSSAAQIVLVRNELDIRSIAGLVALAREKPGKLTYGTGNGSSRGAAELFKMMAQVDLKGVVYQDQPLALADLLRGRLDIIFCDFILGLPPVREGRVHGLAVSSSDRYPGLEQIPTVSDSGVPGYALTTWNAVYLPAGTPRPIVEKLNMLVREVVDSQSYRALLCTTLAIPIAGTPEQLTAFQAKETAKWGEIVRISGMKEP
jgi:tripartite-type tricarboxylate transporter receptor subunit TctC